MFKAFVIVFVMVLFMGRSHAEAELLPEWIGLLPEYRFGQSALLTFCSNQDLYRYDLRLSITPARSIYAFPFRRNIHINKATAIEFGAGHDMDTFCFILRFDMPKIPLRTFGSRTWRFVMKQNTGRWSSMGLSKSQQFAISETSGQDNIAAYHDRLIDQAAQFYDVYRTRFAGRIAWIRKMTAIYPITEIDYVLRCQDEQGIRKILDTAFLAVRQVDSGLDRALSAGHSVAFKCMLSHASNDKILSLLKNAVATEDIPVMNMILSEYPPDSDHFEYNILVDAYQRNKENVLDELIHGPFRWTERQLQELICRLVPSQKTNALLELFRAKPSDDEASKAYALYEAVKNGRDSVFKALLQQDHFKSAYPEALLLAIKQKDGTAFDLLTNPDFFPSDPIQLVNSIIKADAGDGKVHKFCVHHNCKNMVLVGKRLHDVGADYSLRKRFLKLAEPAIVRSFEVSVNEKKDDLANVIVHAPLISRKVLLKKLYDYIMNPNPTGVRYLLPLLSGDNSKHLKFIFCTLIEAIQIQQQWDSMTEVAKVIMEKVQDPRNRANLGRGEREVALKFAVMSKNCYLNDVFKHYGMGLNPGDWYNFKMVSESALRWYLNWNSKITNKREECSTEAPDLGDY